MNERPSHSDRDRLIADTYHEDWTAGPASALAAHAAYIVRRRLTLRRLATTAAAVALFASGTWWFAFPQHPTVRVTAANRSYEIISDAELMSCLGDQSVMILTGADGQKKVIWLDGS
jgi:hypothetical protein